MFEAYLSRPAHRFYNKQSKGIVRRINRAIDRLEKNPFYGTHIKKLRGDLEGLYRYQAGRLRIIYEVIEEKKGIYISTIDYRGKVY